MSTRLATRREPVLSVEASLAFLALFGAAFGQPTLVSNFTVTDVAIGFLMIFLVSSIIGDGGLVGRETHSLLLPLTLIFIGSVAASTFVGIQGWIVRDLIRDIGAFTALFALGNALRRVPQRVLRIAPYVVGAAAVVLTLQLLAGATPEARSAATFPNPNIPAHFLATALGVIAYTTRGRVRVLLVLVGFTGLLATGSFGALLQLFAMVVYMVISNRRRVAPELRARPFLVMGALVALVAAVVAFFSLGAASSPDRLDRSSSGRLDLWGDALELAIEHPLGVGPGTVVNLSLLNLGREPHNEYLAYLAERGPVALVGLVLLGFGLFRLGRRGGGVRMLVAGFAAASMFRETIHYRHIWLYLALLIVWEEIVERQPEATLS